MRRHARALAATHVLQRLLLLTMMTISLGLAMSVALKTHAAEQGELTLGHNVSTFHLDNGLQVVVIPDHRTPVVTHMLWYRVGAADEPEGKSGIAHFLEHLMFKGTKNYPGSTFSDTVARLGGTENAFTSQDYTAYFQRVAREHLKTVMEMEADRMSNLVLSDEVVLPERDVVLEERRSRIENSPSARLSEKMDRALFAVHPYGVPIIGWREEIEGLTRQDAIDFYNRHYTPSNAILVVAGDVTAEEVRELAEQTYGRVEERAEVPPRQRPQEPERRQQGRVELVSEQVGLESLRIAWPVPSYNTAEGNEAAVLDVLSEVLGGGVTSVLYQELVVEKGVASSAGSYYQGTAHDQGRLMIHATPAEGVSLTELEEAVVAAVKRFKAEGPDPQAVARAKTALIAEAVYAQDNQTSLARIYGSALTTGQTVEDVQAWPQKIQAVTSGQVQAAAQAHLDLQRSVVGLLKKPQAGTSDKEDAT